MHAVMNWQESGIPISRPDFRLSPGSVIDLHIAKVQVVEFNQDVLDIARVHAQSVRAHIEAATQDDLSRILDKQGDHGGPCEAHRS